MEGSASRAAAAASGVFLRAAKFHHVTTPCNPTKRRCNQDDESVGSDSAEVIEEHADSDLQSSDCAVETGSDESKADTSDDDDDNLDSSKIPAPVKPAFLDDLIKPASSGAAGARPSCKGSKIAGADRLYKNNFFGIGFRTDYPAVVCTIYTQWWGPAPKGLGRDFPMSRSISPHLLDEDLDSPTRTQICLRSWMLWRARKVGFATSTPSRQLFFADEAARLTKEIAHLPPTRPGCLGNPRANAMLKTWAPDVLKASGR